MAVTVSSQQQLKLSASQVTSSSCLSSRVTSSSGKELSDIPLPGATANSWILPGRGTGILQPAVPGMQRLIHFRAIGDSPSGLSFPGPSVLRSALRPEKLWDVFFKGPLTSQLHPTGLPPRPPPASPPSTAHLPCPGYPILVALCGTDPDPGVDLV